MGGKILFLRSSSSKFSTGGDVPETDRGVGANPTMDIYIFVVTWVLVFVIHLQIQMQYKYIFS